MCDKKEEEDIPQDGSLQDFQSYLFQQEQLAVQNRQQPMQLDQGSHGYYAGGVGDERGSGFQFQEPAPPVLPWPLPPIHSSFNPPIHSSFNPVHLLPNVAGDRDGPFFAPPSSSYDHGKALFGRRPSGLQLAYEAAAADHLGLGGLYISDHLGGRASSSPFTFQRELSQMTAQEIMDAKALAASKSHSEAERRRRERINNHLARLRSLLPSTTKTDKASLLAEVIQHVKDLKRQTSEISDQFEPLPTEVDELTVDHADENGKVVIRASLCCEDRSDLLPDLIKTLKALRLRPLKAEITTLGGRVKNVLLITGEDDSASADLLHSISSIQEALKAVIEKTTSEEPSSSGSIKRQRTTTNISMLERRSV